MSKIRKEDVEKIKNEYNVKSMYVLAREIGVSVPTIKKYLLRLGFNVKNRTEKIQERKNRLLQKINECAKKNNGISKRELAELVGVSQLTLRKYLKK